MASVMAQQGLTYAPSSRDDVVSALLNDYGTGFEEEVSTYSHISAQNESPITPAVQRMNTKFQLRDEQDAPLSPASPPQGSPPRSRKRIVSLSLSRDEKPPSLKLTISNGSTATIPPTPAFPVRSESLPSSESVEEKVLPPPPPPARSERRSTLEQVDMGNQHSKNAGDLARSDSLLSPGGPAHDMVVKRNELPEAGVKRFKSLAELGGGPRGRKGGPLPSAPRPREMSVDSQAEVSQRMEPVAKPQNEQPRNMQAQLPPTPDEDKDATAPAPPQKAFTGLPSNPRAKGPASPLHLRGKSSTGFNVLKAMRPAPPVPTANMNMVTPEMTPSPILSLDTSKNAEMSPVSPLSPINDQGRPSGYEAPPERQQNPVNQTAVPATSILAPVPTKSQTPTRTTSLNPPEPSPGFYPSSAPSRPKSQEHDRLEHVAPTLPTEEMTPEQASSPPPFVPLTRQPISLPITLIPQITPAQLNCYTSHKTTLWSNNVFQPMGCMVCHSNEKDRKWACTWCQLRICRGCSEELRMIPGMKLGKLLEARSEEQIKDEEKPGIIVEDVDEEEAGDSYEDTFRA